MRTPELFVKNGNAQVSLVSIANNRRIPYITLVMRYKVLQRHGTVPTLGNIVQPRQKGRPVEAK